MKVLVIGGTGFIGPHLVGELARMGHAVSVFHRGLTHPDLPAGHIIGERHDLARLRPKADVIIDLILSSAAQAEEVMEAHSGASRGGSWQQAASTSIAPAGCCMEVRKARSIRCL